MSSKKSKERCKITEYQGSYKNANKVRDPIRKPVDLLRTEGEGNYQTTNRENFVPHQIKPNLQKKPKEEQIVSDQPMDLNTEYLSKFKLEKTERPQIPEYFRSKTKPFEHGNEFLDKSVTKKDFDTKVQKEKPVIRRLKDNLEPRSDQPFDHKSTVQDDYTTFDRSPKNIRKPKDAIDDKGLPGVYDTTHGDHFVRHDDYHIKLYKEKPAQYQQPNEPFDAASLMHTDYRPFSKTTRSHPVNRDNNFASDEPVSGDTTHNTDYKPWKFKKFVTSKGKNEYRPKSGQMDLHTTNDDYKSFDNRRPYIHKPGPDQVHFGDSHEMVTVYKEGFKKPRIPSSSKQRPLWNRNNIYKPCVDPFNEVSEFTDNYKRHNTAPAKMIRRESGLFDKDVETSFKTSYREQFQHRKLPECPTDKIVGSNYSGYKLRDDFRSGHRYLIKMEDSDDDSGESRRSLALPPIGDSNIQYVAVR